MDYLSFVQKLKKSFDLKHKKQFLISNFESLGLIAV